jgi:hypothetical protein
LKSRSLNLLEPSGPVQACNGIALPFFYDRNENTKVRCVLGRQILKVGSGLYRLRMLPKAGFVIAEILVTVLVMK